MRTGFFLGGQSESVTDVVTEIEAAAEACSDTVVIYRFSNFSAQNKRKIIDACNAHKLDYFIEPWQAALPGAYGVMVADDAEGVAPDTIRANTLSNPGRRHFASYSSWLYRSNKHPIADIDGLVLGMQVYPIEESVPKPLKLRDTYKYLYRFRSDTNNEVWANLQAFAWPGGRLPTPQEIENMALMACCALVDGLIWYKLDRKLRESPELLSAIRRVHGQAKGLGPPMDYATSDSYAIVRYECGLVMADVNGESKTTYGHSSNRRVRDK